MQWIKSNLTLVICGTLSLASVVLLVLGIVLPDTKSELEADGRVYGNLQALGRSVSNERVIGEERKYQAELAKELQDFSAKVVKTRKHTPLHPDVFPAVKPENQNAPFVFKGLFKKKQEELLRDVLRAKDKPTLDEFEDNREAVAKQKQREERGLDTKSSVSTGGKKATPQRKVSSPPPKPGSEGTTPLQEEMTPEDRVKNDPDAAFGVRRAREIYCYATLAGLDPRPLVTESNFPTGEDMWQAQVSMWIQEDVLGALAGLNNQVAEQLPEKDRWVGELPVKKLDYFAVGSYVLPTKGAGGGVPSYQGTGPGMDLRRQGGTPPSGRAEDVFTQSGCTETADVIQFAVGLVVDARALLKVINTISESGAYTPLLVTYRAVQTDPTLTDYIYGSCPAVEVRLEFEVSLRRADYEQWMPESIKVVLGFEQAVRAD